MKDIDDIQAKRRIRKNYVFNVINYICVLLLPVIIIPYTSRVLGSDGIGKYNFGQSVALIFSLIASLGTALYGQRQIAICKTKEERGKVFFEVQAIRTISYLFILIPYLALQLLNSFAIYKEILLINLLVIIGNYLDISWFYLATEEVKITIIRNMIIKILSIIAIFVFVKNRDHILLYCLIQASTTFLGASLLWFPLSKRIELCNRKSIEIKKHIRPIIALFIPLAASQIYPLVDKTMITLITKNDSLTGMYSQSDTIIKIGLTLCVTALTAVSISRVTIYFNDGEENKAKDIIYNNIKTMYITSFLLIGWILLGADRFVIWFLGEGYEYVPQLLCILCSLFIIMGLTNIIGQLYFVPKGMYDYLSKAVLITTGINILLNALLVTLMGVSGAAIASVLSELALLFMYYQIVKKEIDFKLIFKTSYKYVFSALLSCGVVYFLRYISLQDFWFLVLLAILYTIVYLLILVLLKEETILSLIQFLKRKIGGVHN